MLFLTLKKNHETILTTQSLGNLMDKLKNIHYNLQHFLKDERMIFILEFLN